MAAVSATEPLLQVDMASLLAAEGPRTPRSIGVVDGSFAAAVSPPSDSDGTDDGCDEGISGPECGGLLATGDVALPPDSAACTDIADAVADDSDTAVDEGDRFLPSGGAVVLPDVATSAEVASTAADESLVTSGAALSPEDQISVATDDGADATTGCELRSHPPLAGGQGDVPVIGAAPLATVEAAAAEAAAARGTSALRVAEEETAVCAAIGEAVAAASGVVSVVAAAASGEAVRRNGEATAADGEAAGAASVEASAVGASNALQSAATAVAAWSSDRGDWALVAAAASVVVAPVGAEAPAAAASTGSEAVGVAVPRGLSGSGGGGAVAAWRPTLRPPAAATMSGARDGDAGSA